MEFLTKITTLKASVEDYTMNDLSQSLKYIQPVPWKKIVSLPYTVNLEK